LYLFEILRELRVLRGSTAEFRLMVREAHHERLKLVAADLLIMQAKKCAHQAHFLESKTSGKAGGLKM
jgi:hypothetical protein